MTTEALRSLLDEAMVEGKDYLPHLKQGLADIAILFQEGREGEATNLFLECMEGLEWLNSVLEGMATFRRNMVNEGDLNGRYKGSLQQLLEAWENRDTVLISDLLEFEIIPVIEEFLTNISRGE